MTPHDALRRLVEAVAKCVTIIWAGDEPIMHVRNEAMGEDWVQLAHAHRAAQAALGAGRECANPEQHRCAEYHALEDRLQGAAIEGETLESEITDLRARLAAVEAERNRFRQHALDYEATADALTTALARYGRHEFNACDAWLWHNSLDGSGYYPTGKPCTCGFDAAREGA